MKKCFWLLYKKLKLIIYIMNEFYAKKRKNGLNKIKITSDSAKRFYKGKHILFNEHRYVEVSI